MGELVPARSRWLARRVPSNRARTEIERLGHLAVARIEQETLVRCAEVRAEAIVQEEKLYEVGRFAHDAMSGQALLYAWEAHLAGEDLSLRSELRFFSDVAKLAKGEIIADTIVALRRL